MNLLTHIFFTLFLFFSPLLHFIAQDNPLEEDVIMNHIIKSFNEGFIDSASVISDNHISQFTNNSKFWFYRGLINKEMFKKHEKSTPKSLYREKSAVAFEKSLELEKDTDLVSEIKKNLKYLATTYYNDAVRLLLTEKKENINICIYSFDSYIEIMQLTDENFVSKQKQIDFTNKLGEVYSKIFEKEMNGNEYYELAKNCYLKILTLDPTEKTAKYNLVVLETKYKSKQQQILKAESERKSQEILSLNAIKELAETKLRESRLQEDAKKKELIILKNEKEMNELIMKAEQERKDAITQKEKQKQEKILWSTLGGLFIVLILFGFIYRSNRLKQKTNEIIIKQKEEVELSYQNTKLLSEIGQKITACLTVEDIIEKVHENVNQIMDATIFGIGIYDEKENHLYFPVFIEKGKNLPSYYKLSDENRPGALCFKEQKEIIINDYETDYNKYFPGKTRPVPIVGESPESIIYLPVSTANKKIGVVSVQSFKKNAYSDYHLDILRNLAIYVSIALDNSQAYNKLNLALTEVEKLSIVASKTKNSVIICNSNMELEWVNETFIEINGVTLEQIKEERGKTLMEVSSNKEIKKLILEAIQNKSVVVYNSKNVTKNLGVRWFQTSLTPVLNKKNELQNIIIIDSDITDLKRVEEELRQTNKDITDSIQYAKRIQQSILPSEEKIKALLPESFILYQPKDIVSGDFYWMDSIENNSKIIVAAVDCTGHGVPGALLTMVGSSLLNHIVKELEISNPQEILSEMNHGIIKRFAASGEKTSREGMDMALFTIDKANQKFSLYYSGAYSPLYYIRDNQLVEMNATRNNIGSIPGDQKENIICHNIEIAKGDMLYVFSDGYADQLNGKTGKKFMKGRFKQLLLEIHQKPISEQKRILDETHFNWRGDIFQTDDILVMGFRF